MAPSWRLRLTTAIALLLGACSGGPSILDAQGPGSRRIEGLWWLMLWISVVVLAVVVLLLGMALVRTRWSTEGEPGWGEPFIVVAGVIVPALILGGVFVISLRDLNALTAGGNEARLTIEVVGHDWWWEARYPGEAVTANEIHIPAAEPVRFRVTTADVIHSFWVPQLGPKIDMIPGRENVTWLEADRPGRYRGQCAEFCGLQHANMAFFVVAEPPDRFQSWLENEAAPAPAPDGQVVEGQEVFLTSTCVGCHAIRGTEAAARLGPDLTHLAARETIAAGTLPNTRENLARWITDPQSIKPGAVMPPTQLSTEELEALLDYLESLE
ncbi:MAG: cytochrome c oxidase subunit II [Acidimicrobiia bacterium]